MKVSEGAKLAVLAPRSSLPQNLSTREARLRGTRKAVQESRAEHQAGLKHIAQRVRRDHPAPILHKNAPEKHRGHAFNKGARWGPGDPTRCSALGHPSRLFEQSCDEKLSSTTKRGKSRHHSRQRQLGNSPADQTETTTSRPLEVLRVIPTLLGPMMALTYILPRVLA